MAETRVVLDSVIGKADADRWYTLQIPLSHYMNTCAIDVDSYTCATQCGILTI